jgi:glycosyltransferase involved in cell wall biosynthesis
MRCRPASAQAPDALAAALRALLAAPQRRASFGAAGRRRVESEFALPVTLARYEQLYMTLATDARVFERIA